MVEKRTAIYTEEMLESMKKVEAARAANAEFEPRRMTAEEKETLLATYHPDYKQSEFRVLEIGVNKGEKVPLELADILQANSRIKSEDIDPIGASLVVETYDNHDDEPECNLVKSIKFATMRHTS